jgi:hypothetical protein
MRQSYDDAARGLGQALGIGRTLSIFSVSRESAAEL